MADLITDNYRSVLRQMHAEDAGWAMSGPRFIDRVRAIIRLRQPQTVLDYGCGKGALLHAMAVGLMPNPPALAGYDPAIKEYEALPEPADMVLCTDVLEHIEPEHIDAVLNHIRDLTKKDAYFVIHTGDCGFVLPDGRPAHILQRPQIWWEDALKSVFKGFVLAFHDTGLPLRFEVTATRG